MNIQVIKASLKQKPILSNLLELYAYEFTQFWDFDIGEDGLYGYERLPLYWTESNRFPYLIYVDEKIAGFVLVQKGSPISDEKEVYDISEFFIMQKYKRKGIGSVVAIKVWEMFKGSWQVRVLSENTIACSFWPKAIEKFLNEKISAKEIPIKGTLALPQKKNIKGDLWVVYRFES